jgi:hypothetical protein
MTDMEYENSAKLKLSTLCLWGGGGNGCEAPPIINLKSRWRYLNSLTLQPIYPRGKKKGKSSDPRRGGKEEAAYLYREPNTIQPTAHRFTRQVTPEVHEKVSSSLMMKLYLFRNTIFGRVHGIILCNFVTSRLIDS